MSLLLSYLVIQMSFVIKNLCFFLHNINMFNSFLCSFFLRYSLSPCINLHCSCPSYAECYVVLRGIHTSLVIGFSICFHIHLTIFLSKILSNQAPSFFSLKFSFLSSSLPFCLRPPFLL